MMDTMSKSTKICDNCGYSCSEYEKKSLDTGINFVSSAFPVAIPKEQYVRYLGLLYKKAQKTNECADWVERNEMESNEFKI